MDLPERRRLVVASVGRCVLTGVGALAVYAALPLRGTGDGSVVLRLTLASIVFLAIVALQIRSIVQSEHPNVRAVEVLATTIAMLLVLFASFYMRISVGDAASFNQPLDHIDSLYFTITVLATVGFGDIAPVSNPARLAVSFQMMLDLVVIGVVVRLLFTAAQRGVARRDRAA